MNRIHDSRLDQFSWRKDVTRVFVAAVLLLSASALCAQEPNPPDSSRPGGTGSLTLKRAVELAVQNSREIALAREQFNVAEKTAAVLRSQFRPFVYTGFGMAYSRGFPPTPGGAPPPLINVAYSQALLNGPARGEVRAAEERAEIQRLKMESVRDSVIVRTASAYLELAMTRHSLALLRRERESAQKIVGVTRERMEAGLELPVEGTKAQLTAAQVEQRLARLEGREESLANELSGLTGLPSDPPLEVAPEQLPPAAEQPVPKLVELALANNVTVKQAESERRAWAHRVKGERGGYWPTVDLIGQYGVRARFNTSNQYQNVNLPRHSYLAGVNLNIPLYSVRTRAAVSLAKAELRVAELASKGRQNSLGGEVRRQARQTRELDATREVARLELRLAQENLQAMQAKFQEGRANLRDLEKARLEESDKWMAFLDADYKCQHAQLELLQTTGQLARLFQ